MAVLYIDKEKCKGCELCVRACPKDLLALSKTFINRQGYHPVEIKNMEVCIGCASCALTCPDICIEIER